MSGFKNTTRTIAGHHAWDGTHVATPPKMPATCATGGTINRMAHGGPVDSVHGMGPKDKGGVRDFKPYGEDHGLIRRQVPMTEELQEAGGTSPLKSGYAGGGPAKHFHVHKHYHTGGGVKTRSKSYDGAERAAERQVVGAKPSMKKGGKWIQGAIKHPGALHKTLGVPQGKKIPAKKLAQAAHSENPTTRRRAALAKTLGKVRKNAGGALYAEGGTVSKLAVGGVPQMGAAPAVGALGRMALRPPGLPMRGAPPMRRPMSMPGPSPMVRASGGSTSMREIAHQEVRKHVKFPAPTGHKGLGARLK